LLFNVFQVCLIVAVPAVEEFLELSAPSAILLRAASRKLLDLRRAQVLLAKVVGLSFRSKADGYVDTAVFIILSLWGFSIEQNGGGLG
jgi:hypothetical protein